MTGGPIVQVQSWGDAVFASLSNTLYALLGAIPLIIGALLILLIGWILSNILAGLVKKVVAGAGADRLVRTHGAEDYGTMTTKWPPSRMAGEIVRWLIRLVFLNAAANVLGLTQISLLLNQIVLWLPNLVVAAVILFVAPLLARFLRGAIEVGAGEMGFTNGGLLGQIAYIAVLAMAVIIAINQLGIAANLVNILFVGLVGALALAFGLAFGLGGRDVAAQLTQQWYSASQGTAERVQTRASRGLGSAAKSSGGPAPSKGS